MPRPRIQDRPRYPSGKLKPAGGYSPAVIRRILDQARLGAANPLLGSELGRLRLHGHITDREMSAGTRYAELHGRYTRLMRLPAPVLTAHDAGPTAPDPDDAAVRAARDRLDAARANLRRIGSGAVEAVEAMCVRDEATGYAARYLAILGLRALVIHFGLTGRR